MAANIPGPGHTPKASPMWDIEELFIGAVFGSWAGSVQAFWTSILSAVTLLAIIAIAPPFLRIVATDNSGKVAVQAAFNVLLIWAVAIQSLWSRGVLGTAQTFFVIGTVLMLIFCAFQKRRRL